MAECEPLLSDEDPVFLGGPRSGMAGSGGGDPFSTRVAGLNGDRHSMVSTDDELLDIAADGRHDDDHQLPVTLEEFDHDSESRYHSEYWTVCFTTFSCKRNSSRLS
jgi:hypothetical protein